MESLKQREKSNVFILTGFVGGVFFLLLFYYAIFDYSPGNFTFSALGKMHRSNLVFFLIDIIPFITSYISFERFKRMRAVEKESFLKEQELGNDHQRIIDFSDELSAGNYSYKPHSVSEPVVSALENLRQTLHGKSIAEQQRKQEEWQRNWISEGLASFREELSQHNKEMAALSSELLSKLVKYMNVNQGGFYLVESEADGTRYLDMKACYAFDRNKFADKRIEWGEGIIGSCVLGKKHIYLDNIPDSYLEVTSALGKTNPKFLLIVPMISHGEVNGIIDLASFRAFENFEIDFVNRIAESFSLAFDHIQKIERIDQLLMDNKAQAEELKRQEETSRVNRETLIKTQELTQQQAEKFMGFSNTVNHTLIHAEYDKNGYLLYANSKFLRKLGYSGNREVENKHISLFIHEKDLEWFSIIWDSLAEGGRHFEGYMKHITKQAQDLWTMATYTCMRKESGEVDKILFLAIDTTEQKKQSLDFEQQISAINSLNLKAEFTPDGKILSTNDLFNRTFKFSSDQLEKMNVFNLPHPKDIENFNDIWEEVIRGKPFRGQLRMLTRKEEEKWFRASLGAVNDMYGEVTRVIMLANEITNEKMMEAESLLITEQLKRKEEQLRLTGIELKKNLAEAKKEWEQAHKSYIQKIGILESVLDMTDVITFSVDNTGKFVYVNEKARDFFGLKTGKLFDEPAIQLINGKVDDLPEFIVNLLDPKWPKSIPPAKFEIIEKGKKQKKEFKTAYKVTEEYDKVIYSLSLQFNDEK